MYFKIVPNISTLFYSGSHVNESQDIAIRESIINDTGNLDFRDSFSPVRPSSDLTSHVVIANDPDNIKTGSFSIIL